MTFVAAPGIVSFAGIWSLDNQVVENTFAYHMAGAIDDAVLHAMATTYASWANTNKFLWPTNAQLLKMYARDLTSQFSFSYEGVPLVPVTGTKTGITLPSNVSFAVKRETGLAGRKNRGRVYWIGLTDGDRSDDNHITAGRALAFVTGLTSLMSAQLSDNGATEVIYHRFVGTGTPIIGYTYSDLTIDAMRRRLPDHNRHH